MSAPKARRMPERIKEQLAELMPTLKDPRIGFVTITDVRTSADVSHATVYYTVLAPGPHAGATDRSDEAVVGDDEAQRRAREHTAEGLASATPLLRRELGRRLRVRQVPTLDFVHDPVPEQGRRIEQLIREARTDR